MSWKKKVKIISTKGFSLDELQNYLVFQLYPSYFTVKDTKIGSWDSKGMSREGITPPSKTDKSFYPELIYFYGIYDLKFKGICLKQNSASFPNIKNIVNLYYYKLETWSKDLRKW